MGNDSKQIPQAFADTLVLVLDLMGFETAGAAGVGKALKQREKEVVKAIQEAVDEQTKKLFKKHFPWKPAPAGDALGAAQAVGEKALEELTRDAEAAIKATLKEAWKESPLGIWVDDNEWVLYIVVPVVVVGGAFGLKALYDARVGDQPASWAANMANKHLEFKKLGNLTFGAADVAFVPSKHQGGAKVFAAADWKPIKVKLSVGGLFKEDDSPAAKTSTGPPATITGWNAAVDLTYKGAGAASNLDLSIKAYVQRTDRDQVVGGSASAGYKLKLWEMPAKLTAEGNWKHTDTYGAGAENAYAVQLGLQVDL